jgi:hypothetical protein
VGSTIAPGTHANPLGWDSVQVAYVCLLDVPQRGIQMMRLPCAMLSGVINDLAPLSRDKVVELKLSTHVDYYYDIWQTKPEWKSLRLYVLKAYSLFVVDTI